MPQCHAAGTGSSDVKPLEDEIGQLVVKDPQPEAGDATRETEASLFEMAEVIDECPPLAKFFDGDFSERSLRKMPKEKTPCTLMGDGEGSRADVAASHGQCEATSPEPSKCMTVRGASAAAAAVAGGTTSSSGGSTSKKTLSSAHGSQNVGAAGSMSLPWNRRLPVCSLSEEGASGRRGPLGTGLELEEYEDWSELEQASDMPEENFAAFARKTEATPAGRTSNAAVRPWLSANQVEKEMDTSVHPFPENRKTCAMPSDVKSMIRHQDRHVEWNSRQPPGSFAMLGSSHRNSYLRTIHIAGENEGGVSHSKRKWGLQIDDCTKDRFEDGATDEMDCGGALGAELGSCVAGHKGCISDLPGTVMRFVVGYIDRGRLGETSKTIRAIIPVKYKIDASETKRLFFDDGGGMIATPRMGLDPYWAVLPPRAVKAITITGCYKCTENDIVRFSQVAAFRQVIAHAIPTLCSITLEGKNRAANTFVSTLLATIADSGHAPLLTHVRLLQSPTSVEKATGAISQGFWPALQVLELPHCHGNAVSMTRLASAIREGRLRDLRVLDWDNQGEGGRRRSNLILEALSTGGCPKMEFLSFARNPRFDEMSLSFLGSALQACTGLRELHMDCTIDPRDQLQQLTKTITSGYAPNLDLIHLHIKKGVRGDLVGPIKQDCKDLKNAGKSRSPTPVQVNIFLGGNNW